MTDNNQEHRVGVFFDYENIVYSLRNRFEQKANFDALITKCREFGRLTVARAFADWGLPYMSPALMYALQSSGFELVFVPTGSTQSNTPRKNVADLYMAISVMDVLFTRPDIDTFVLLTGDRDFMVLVNYLKQMGKRVIAIGVDGSSSYYLTQAVDDFFYYSEVEEIFEDQPRRQKGRPTNIYDALQQAVQVMREKGRSPRLTNLKPVMVELMGNFDEKNYTDSKGRNFAKFKDFVQEAQRRGTVRLLRRGNVIEVHLPEEDIGKISHSKPADDPVDDPIKVELAFKLLVKAVTDATNEKRSTRLNSIRNRLKKLLPAFDVTNIDNGDGDYPFSTIADFVKAAEEEGLVTLEGEGAKMDISLAAKGDELKEVVEIEQETRETLTGDAAREALLGAIQAYKNYPTSFLSLAGFVHRHNDSNNVEIDENEARDLMTEAVKGNLLKQIVLDDGRRQYELDDSAEKVKAFLGQDAAEVEDLDAVPDVEEPVEEELLEKPAFNSPYEALAEAVRTILQDGKEPVLPRVKSAMIHLLGNFNEKNHTDADGNAFAKFKDFVADAEKQGYVRMQRDGSVNRVFLIDKETAQSVEADDAIETSIIDDADVAEAVAASVSVEDEPAKQKDSKSKKKGKKSADADLITIDETQQRELIVDALRSFGGYDAPFMAILAHCRAVRNERSVSIPSNDLRDLLSNASRYSLITATSPKGERPTKYTFADDAARINSYLAQESLEQVDEESAPAPAIEESKPEVVNKTVVKPAKKTKAAPEANDSAVRQLIVDAVAAYDSYPAAFKDVLSQVQTAQKNSDIDVSEKSLRDLISAATRGGILKIVSKRGVRPTKYDYTADKAAIATYLGTAEDTKASDPVAEKPAKKSKASKAKKSEAVEEVPATAADVFVAAVKVLVANDADPVLGAVKKQMKKIMRSFDEKKILDENGRSHKSFKSFARSVEAEGLIKLEKAGRTERAIVVNGAAKADVEDSAETPQTTDTTAAPSSPLEQAFVTLTQAAQGAQDDGSSPRLSAIRSRIVKLDKAFDVNKLKDSDGKKFKNLTAFMRAAEAAGHVKLSGKGVGLEIRPA